MLSVAILFAMVIGNRFNMTTIQDVSEDEVDEVIEKMTKDIKSSMGGGDDSL